MRHAHATRCFVELVSDGGDLQLEIVDNGRGMGKTAAGNGLRGMAERLQPLGGKLDVVSLQGTRLSIQLPKAAPRAVAPRLEPVPQT